MRVCGTPRDITSAVASTQRKKPTRCNRDSFPILYEARPHATLLVVITECATCFNGNDAIHRKNQRRLPHLSHAALALLKNVYSRLFRPGHAPFFCGPQTESFFIWGGPPLVIRFTLSTRFHLFVLHFFHLPLASVNRNFSIIISLYFLSLTEMAGSPAEINDEGGGEGDGEMTQLQKHAAFFDRNKDGVIYPWETFQGFRAIGAGLGLSLVGAVFINGFLGPKTRTGKIPSPLFPIYVKNISKGKHGSDTGAYDEQGRFVPAKFEEIFQKHAHTNPNALTSDELLEMIRANRDPKDYKGWVGSWVEWKVLYSLCKDDTGLLPKETIRAVYDGSLFFKMEEEMASSKKKA
ncbi:hypothetical protein IEQ34_007317 [Dendrobium chrysotoxum]|uniref:Peroxygenase 4 n=1 Tax=Dendrobium chrysotoxum TaxID=161865 RepID=A0AAV7H6K9_DENCH|nr:hypothetical protein IEQ34_007317 [Dendrobium chrysotoxum]